MQSSTIIYSDFLNVRFGIYDEQKNRQLYTMYDLYLRKYLTKHVYV